MQKYMTVKYAGLLLGLIALFGIFHGIVIGPVLSGFVMDSALGEIVETITLFIIEPVICVLIMVFLINRKETRLYDSIS